MWYVPESIAQVQMAMEWCGKNPGFSLYLDSFNPPETS